MRSSKKRLNKLNKKKVEMYRRAIIFIKYNHFCYEYLIGLGSPI